MDGCGSHSLGSPHFLLLFGRPWLAFNRTCFPCQQGSATKIFPRCTVHRNTASHAYGSTVEQQRMYTCNYMLSSDLPTLLPRPSKTVTNSGAVATTTCAWHSPLACMPCTAPSDSCTDAARC
eukprot:94041-Pelagomonas_calceolata.AAC.3